ncbi:penicillin-binding protein 1A [Prevotella aff. ruminicola Tc2-24]|uniref:Penicillin-binding protein 1A n=1 Tax=Prevotella aff. ruminicola Tc2-24 TaxID=81582 RepID=A0A1I0PVV2_9BACT|nr:transglycosylase domain-containing protein [Prevotella aff. ruminicola Tc2-24]SEW18381.1 penicillin-binding protein 1A [Prevotella aff. ruminicola Tc2-24]
MRKLFVYFLWTLLTISVLGAVFAFYAIDKGWIGYMPPVEDLQNPINRFATQIYSADGKIMGTWNYNRENRVMVDYSKLPTSLVQALVATEDVRFYDHSGIDFYALGRAIIKRGVLGQKSAGGGSTITQQLAKQLYSERAKSTMERLFQKPIEWVIAVKLERNYTKDEIITMYLNYFDFLHNAVGIKVAADTYFSKEPKDLTVTEAATLVGLCKNPSYYNPVRYPDRSRDRRNVVLGQMLKAGYLSEADYEKYCAEPLTLKFHVSDHRDGIAVYFREFLRKYMTAKKPDRALYPSWNMVKYYNDSINWETDPLYGWCNKNRKRNGDYYSIYTDGLKVYTTIDSKMQQYAEQAAYQHVVKYLQPAFAAENQKKANAPYSSNLTPEQVRQIINRSIRQSERYRVLHESGASEDEIQKSFRTPVRMTVFTYHGEIDTTMTPIDSIRYYKSFLRTGFVSVCPQNGHVKAYVGGLNYEHFAYDMVSEGRRQVGSTIKPYLYSLAMENGFSPCDEAPNVQQTYMVAGRPWTPRNGSRARYGEMVTLKWGLQQSNNWISAYLMSKLSPQAFVDLLREYGIRNPEIHPSMSLCLGPCDISVAEMASAYTAFVNHGIRAALMYVTKIEDGEGNVIAQFQPRMNEVISEESAHKMLYMLKAVVDGGTAGRLRFKYGLKGSIAGKTGTTNNNSDAWFMGITPTLVNACWVGGDDRDIHFNTMFYGQGASMALPIFALYMQKVYADPQLGYNEDATFDLPAGYDPCSFVDEALESSDNDFEELFE